MSMHKGYRNMFIVHAHHITDGTEGMRIVHLIPKNKLANIMQLIKKHYVQLLSNCFTTMCAKVFVQYLKYTICVCKQSDIGY